MSRKSINSSHLMSSYEKDLVFMAMRYAVGRSTISCTQIAKDMAKNLYNKMSTSDQIFFAIDIRKRIEDALHFMPFSFCMSFDIDRNSSDYEPLDRFIEWMDANNIDTSEDLRLWEEIVYLGEGKYNATQTKCVEDKYATNAFNDLLVWNRLAKFLDYRTHKFCIIKNDKGEEELVEYFVDYTKSFNKITLAYSKIKISVCDYMKNPYVVYTISEENIVKDNLTDKEVIGFCNTHFLGTPISLTIQHNN